MGQDIGPYDGLIWTALVYTLMLSVFLTLVGRISDIFGRRWVFAGGSIIGLIGSIICAVAKDIPTLIGGTTLIGMFCLACIRSKFSSNLIRNRCIHASIVSHRGRRVAPNEIPLLRECCHLLLCHSRFRIWSRNCKRIHSVYERWMERCLLSSYCIQCYSCPLLDSLLPSPDLQNEASIRAHDGLHQAF